MKKASIILFALVLLAMSAGFVFGASPAKVKVGLSFGDFYSERWPREKGELQSRLEAMGFEVLWKEAAHDAAVQNTQLRSLAAAGCKAIIVVAEDGAACAAEVDLLAAQGVKVIAYDRLIPTEKLAAYISFSYVEVGRRQGEGILARQSWGNFVLLGGSPTDPAASAFRAGQMQVLQPAIDSGKVKVVADRWVDNWDPAIARKIMREVIKGMPRGKTIHAVVASNDGTALGALLALKEVGLAGKVAVSGQDATAAGCASIVKGELSFTVLKDTRLMYDPAAELADSLARGKPVQGLVPTVMADILFRPGLVGSVPCYWMPCILVDKENMDQLVIATGFQSRADVYGE